MSAALDQAIVHHRAGELAAAQSAYLAVLNEDAHHPEANHNLGALLVQQGDAEQALPFCLAALEGDSGCAQYWLTYIDALDRSGQRNDALAVLEMARSQGLEGEQVEVLARRMNPPRDVRPEYGRIDEIVALFGQGRLTEAEALAEAMTRDYPQHEFGWKALGAVYQQQGKIADALTPMKKAAELSPQGVESHYNLGVIYQALEQLEDAEAAYRQALQIDEHYADAHCNLGVVLQSLARLDEACASYRRAIELKPDYVSAHCNLGDALRVLSCCDEAALSYRRALALDGSRVRIHCALGHALCAAGKYDEAVGCYHMAMQLDPQSADACDGLGACLLDLNLLAEAEEVLRKALQLDSESVTAYCNLGATLNKQGRRDESEDCYRQAILRDPDHIPSLTNLGIALSGHGNIDEAERYLRHAISLNPDYLPAYCNLGVVLNKSGRVAEAEALYRRALMIQSDSLLNPDKAQAYSSFGDVSDVTERDAGGDERYRYAVTMRSELAEIHNNLGGILQRRGQQDEALSCFREALRLKPAFSAAHSNLIFVLDLMPAETVASLQAERRRWDERHAAKYCAHLPHSNPVVPNRVLRIGYVSGDFKDHSAPRVFGGMLTHYDRSQFQVYAYFNLGGQDDSISERLKQGVTCWRNIAGMSDEAVAALIREDGIDILVDLSGHSMGNRLLVFARKPAPVQVTAWGYASGTGLSAMDAFLADPVVVPFEERSYFAEKIVDLPCVVGSIAFDEYPGVNPLPANVRGYVTFGSFNRLTKISDETCRLWCRLMQAVPGSRLLMKAQELSDPVNRAAMLAKLADGGIEEGRISMMGRTTWTDQMLAHHDIDIALDPFPHGGGVTSQESLMMGVPVLTLRWPTTAGRVTSSIMTSLGLADWVADTQDGYVALAKEKASDLQSLLALRAGLSQRYTSSVMGNPALYAAAVEAAYRKLWREWCAKSTEGLN